MISLQKDRHVWTSITAGMHLLYVLAGQDVAHDRRRFDRIRVLQREGRHFDVWLQVGQGRVAAQPPRLPLRARPTVALQHVDECVHVCVHSR